MGNKSLSSWSSGKKMYKRTSGSPSNVGTELIEDADARKMASFGWLNTSLPCPTSVPYALRLDEKVSGAGIGL